MRGFESNKLYAMKKSQLQRSSGTRAAKNTLPASTPGGVPVRVKMLPANDSRNASAQGGHSLKYGSRSSSRADRQGAGRLNQRLDKSGSKRFDLTSKQPASQMAMASMLRVGPGVQALGRAS